jgi:hypothetical protein
MLSIPKVGAKAPATMTLVDTAPTAPLDAALAAPSEPAGDEAIITDPYTLKLSVPLRTHQGMVHELKLREPIAADYFEVGRVPFDVRGDDDNRRITIDFKLMKEWAARLTGHDEIILGQLSAKDWLGIAARINSLLMQAGSTT